MYASRLVPYAYPSASLSASCTGGPQEVEPHEAEVSFGQQPAGARVRDQEENDERREEGERAGDAERSQQDDEEQQGQRDQNVPRERRGAHRRRRDAVRRVRI